MNAKQRRKQRRKLIRKHIKSIVLIRVKSRLAGGDGWPGWNDYALARDLEAGDEGSLFMHMEKKYG